MGEIYDAGDSEDERHPDGNKEQEHADAESAHHLDHDERAVGQPWEKRGDEVHVELRGRSAEEL